RTTLNQLLLVARQYVAPVDRAKTIEKVGSDLWTLATLAAPGSDAQFQFVKFFAQIASIGDHVSALRGLLDGTVVLKGLAIDTDLGWELLEGLVLNGAATPADIDAALEKDNTANGQQAAARARATFATAEGKLAAFASIVDNDTAPNAIVRNTALGFQHVNDSASLEPLVEKYFGSLGTVWENR